MEKSLGEDLGGLVGVLGGKGLGAAWRPGTWKGLGGSLEAGDLGDLGILGLSG